jgi:uncharacterized membrane protein
MTLGRVILWLVLGASLMANAVVLGLWLRFRDVGGMQTGWSDLPAETRGHFRAELAANRGELAGLLAELRAARSAMFAAAEARPYDRTAVVAAQTRVREATTALQTASQALMLNALDRAAAP